MEKRLIALIAVICAITVFLTSCSPYFTVFDVGTKKKTHTKNEKSELSDTDTEETEDYGTFLKKSAAKPNGKEYPTTEYDYLQGIAAGKGSSTKVTPVSFASLDLKRPSVVHPAEIVFGTYQNMGQLSESPNGWTFCRANADGIMFHEAYWLNGSSPQATEGKAIGDMIKGSKLKTYLEYGMPKSDIIPTADDDGTVYGYTNALRAKDKISRFEKNTGIDIDVVNLEFYSGSVTNILGNLGLDKNWANHKAIGVPYLLKTYDSFYAQFKKDYPDMKINHVGCPNLTGWVSEADGGTIPRHWIQYYTQPYWTSYQAYDITIPIFNKYGKDGTHIGWVHDSPWTSFDSIDTDAALGYVSKNGLSLQNNVVIESMNIIQGKFGLNSTLICGSWEGGSGATVETGGALLNEKNADADRYFWESAMKTIYNAQYFKEYHNAYLLESYWDGPYRMVPETTKYTFMNLVATAVKYIKGVGQKLDLYVKDASGKVTGRGVYADTPCKEQIVNGAKTYTVTVQNNGEVDCSPWLRAVENKNGATVRYSYKGKDITEQITSAEGYTFRDLFEDKNGNFDLYTSSEDHPLNTHYDEENHGMKPNQSISIEVTVSGGKGGSVAICGFYNMQDPTDTVKDVVTFKF